MPLGPEDVRANGKSDTAGDRKQLRVDDDGFLYTRSRNRRTLFDYAGRLDSNPVYIGENDQGVATSVATWIVRRITYDLSSRATDIQVLVGKWDDRAVLGWT